MCVFCWFSHSCRLLALVSFSQLLMIGFLSVECVKICFLSQGLNFGVSDYSWMADFYITCLLSVCLKNLLLQFCFDFTLYLQSGKSSAEEISSHRVHQGNHFFEWCQILCNFCFFNVQKRREKGEDLRLLFFCLLTFNFNFCFLSFIIISHQICLGQK